MTTAFLLAALVAAAACTGALAALLAQRTYEERRIRRDTPPRPDPQTDVVDLRAAGQSTEVLALGRNRADETLIDLRWKCIDADRGLDLAFDRFTNATKEATNR